MVSPEDQEVVERVARELLRHRWSWDPERVPSPPLCACGFAPMSSTHMEYHRAERAVAATKGETS